MYGAVWATAPDGRGVVPLDVPVARHCPTCEVGWHGKADSHCWNCGRFGKRGSVPFASTPPAHLRNPYSLPQFTGPPNPPREESHDQPVPAG